MPILRDDPQSGDYYQTLSVPTTARLIEIKKAFRSLQRRAHPDSTHSASSRALSAKLNAAYQVLSDPLSRLEYDLQRGFRDQNEQNLSKLQKLRERKAKKLRENMSATAARSREIESRVTTLFSNGTRVQHCGLIITKAKYGLVDLEKEHRLSAANVHSLVRSNTADPVPDRISPRLDALKRVHSAKSAESDAVGTESASTGPNGLRPEYTIDVTDAVQCLVVHRGANGGYLLIADNADKSRLDGFYDPTPWIKRAEDRKLEIEYLFNRKHHYTEVGHLEQCRIPDEAHIVHVVDHDIVDHVAADLMEFEFARSDGSTGDLDEKTESTRSALVDRTGIHSVDTHRSQSGSAEDLSFAMATYSPSMSTIPSYGVNDH